MCSFVFVSSRSARRTTALAGVAGVALALAAAAPPAALAQPAVVYVVNGHLLNRDYFGGGGILENTLPTTTGDSLSFNQTLVNPAGTSEVSLAYNSSVSGNTGTFSSSFSSLVQRSYGATGEFFIYANNSDIAVDAYILGGQGTPYQFDVVSTGSTNSTNSDADFKATGSADSLGQAYPGFAYIHPNSGGTYSQMGVSSNVIISYLGFNYSRIGPGPRGQSNAFFGITGTPTAAGFSSISATHSFTSTVTNLGVSSSVGAPEPSTLALLGMGFISGGTAGTFVRLRQRRRQRK